MTPKKQHFHFMGIGGIGMSGIATILHKQGHTVSGCDTNMHQATITDLKRMGCLIFDHHNSEDCLSLAIDVVVYIQVYATEIRPYHQEIEHAQARNIQTISRSGLLAQLMNHHYGISVSGSHGKTTTSSMIAHTLLGTHMDPTFVVGGYVTSIESNAHLGSSTFFVAEADESDRSLLQLPTMMGVITNIDLEHLETYADLADLQNTFHSFCNAIPAQGSVIICADDPHSQYLLGSVAAPVTTFGFLPTADVYATDVALHPDSSTCIIHIKKNNLQGVLTLAIPGRYNILNALATIAACTNLDIPLPSALAALGTFKGVGQRFSHVGTYKNTLIFDDYGHHPTEIEQVLQVARHRAQAKLFVLFQPHRYTRTQALWHQFIATFLESTLDHLIITDIYPAFESPIDHISSKALVDHICEHNPSFKIDYIPYQSDFAHIKEFLLPLLGQNDLLLLLGAGRVHLLTKHII